MIKSIKKETKGKAGRKASGLRDLSPEAARLAIGRAALAAVEAPVSTDLSPAAREAARAEVARKALGQAVKVVRGAVSLQRAVVRATGETGGVPTLERLLREDVAVAGLQTADDGEFTIRPVLRSKTMQEVLLDCGVDRTVAWAADQFMADVERSTIGRLTASYGEGIGGASAAEPLRVLQALDRLGRAQSRLTHKERLATWGFLVLGMTATDVGWALIGDKLGKPKGGERDMRTATALVVEAALERMAVFYKSVA